MKFGINLLLWSGEIGDEHLSLIESLKTLGYDGVEVPMFSYDVKKYAALGKRLDALGLGRTAVTVRNQDDNPISSEASVRAKGVELNRRALDCCAALGATCLCGPYHSAIGLFSGKGPTEEEYKWGVASMRAVAEHAETVKVDLAVEYLNRFECYLLNSAADTARFVRDVSHPRCRMMYDTFHANIEEKDIRAAIKDCARSLIHVHISENDRSTPGAGHVSWKETFDGLKEVGYDGWLMVEAFGLALPELAAATKIWRRMFVREEQLARDALKFMKAEWAKRAGA